MPSRCYSSTKTRTLILSGKNRGNEQFIQPVGPLSGLLVHARQPGNYLDAADFVGSRLTVTNANELNGHTFATPNHPRRSVQYRADIVTNAKSTNTPLERSAVDWLAVSRSRQAKDGRPSARAPCDARRGFGFSYSFTFFSFRPASTGEQPGGRCGGEASPTRGLVNLGSLFYPYPRRATLSSSPIYKCLRKSVKRS